MIDRRSFLTAAAALVPAAAQTPRDWAGRETVRYPDPDIVSLDRRFDKYKIGSAAIERLYTGAQWAEGPAWDAAGRYLVWSDIPANRQMRWLEEDGHVSVFHDPSGYSNGNTFDFEGRLVSCQHGPRRVARYEHDGSVTVIADRWNGKRLNSPNDIVVHPDGGIWFTDPTYGILGNYEGFQANSELPTAVYRADPKTGKLDLVAADFGQPNGLCFSPDYQKLYIIDSGDAKDIHVFDVADGRQLRNGRVFSKMVTAKGSGIADGMRADIDGNLWVGAGWVGPGYDGVHVLTPGGERIGMILLPEVCANLCFGGPKRNRLFMAASQSLYAVYVGTRGAHVC
ncbi:MAG: SMP-30/gluconolactonase/LRE family protein [Bryobacteraceae bacterium]